MAKKILIVLLIAAVIILLVLSDFAFKFHYWITKTKYMRNLLYCENNNECTESKTQSHSCSCPVPINIYNKKRIVSSVDASGSICGLYCPPSISRCINNECKKRILTTEEQKILQEEIDKRLENSGSVSEEELNSILNEVAK